MVRDRRAIEAHAVTDLLLRQTRVRERGERMCELHWVQVVALDVFHERDLESVFAVDIRDHRRDRLAPGHPRSAPAALAHNEFVSVSRAPHDHRLQNAVSSDRIGQALELCGFETAPWLFGIRIDCVDGDFGRSLVGLWQRFRNDRRRRRRNQRTDSAPQCVSTITHARLRSSPIAHVRAVRARGAGNSSRPSNGRRTTEWVYRGSAPR